MPSRWLGRRVNAAAGSSRTIVWENPGVPAYVDPCKHASTPTLLAGLIAVPTKIGLQPLETQVTTILAWLLSRSERFARAFCDLFLIGPAVSAAHASPRIGVRTWITLPSLPGTGKLFPDLSLEGCDGRFQLLVEVKVHAGLHQFPALGGLWQPEAYIAAWKQEKSGAAIRRVGTLTRKGVSYRPPDDGWRGADVTWDSVRSLVVARNFPREIRAVAEEFELVLDAVVLQKSVEISSELAGWATAFLGRVVVELNQRVVVAKVGRIVHGKDYRGRYVSFSGATGSDFRLWFAVTETNARYNQPLSRAVSVDLERR